MKQFLDVVGAVTLSQLHVGEKLRSSSVSPNPPHKPLVPVQRTRSTRTPVRSPSDAGIRGLRARPRARARSNSRAPRGRDQSSPGGGTFAYPSTSSSSDEEDILRDQEAVEYYLLRNFSITGKGVVNRGDSVKSRRSSADSNDCPSPAERARSPVKTPDTRAVTVDRPSYRVVILGSPGVGKSSLVQQFSTSDFLHAHAACCTPDDTKEKSVNILLDGEESELSFVEQHDADVSGDYDVDPHAFCVVFSSSDRHSFHVALDALEHLWNSETVGTKAVILVANKTDLVRGRAVTTDEAKTAATQYDCKYIETSVAINHNVDELLVGLLTQIRLKLKDPEKSRSIFRKRSFSRRKSLGKMALTWKESECDTCFEPTDVLSKSSSRTDFHGKKIYRGSKTSASFRMKSLLDKVLARDSKAKSCEKLHVL